MFAMRAPRLLKVDGDYFVLSKFNCAFPGLALLSDTTVLSPGWWDVATEPEKLRLRCKPSVWGQIVPNPNRCFHLLPF